MTKKQFNRDEYVKKSTTVIIALFTLLTGFLGGIALSVYQSVPGMPSKTFEAEKAADNAEHRIKMLEAETAKKPNNYEAWVQLGHTYFDSDLHAKAIGAYEKALGINNRSADLWTDLGVMYRRNGQSQKAIESFDTARKMDPTHETSLFNKGIVLLHDIEDKEAALAAWRALVDLNPLAMAPNGQSVDELITHYTDHPQN